MVAVGVEVVQDAQEGSESVADAAVIQEGSGPACGLQPMAASQVLHALIHSTASESFELPLRMAGQEVPEARRRRESESEHVPGQGIEG